MKAWKQVIHTAGGQSAFISVLAFARMGELSLPTCRCELTGLNLSVTCAVSGHTLRALVDFYWWTFTVKLLNASGKGKALQLIQLGAVGFFNGVGDRCSTEQKTCNQQQLHIYMYQKLS